MTKARAINAGNAPATYGGYAQAVEVTWATRILYISGQIPARPDGSVPTGFKDQARQAWANVEAQLNAADMTLDHIVKQTTYLADRAYRLEHREVRQEVMGDRAAAMTVVVCDIVDEAWLLEIEAIAVA